MAVEKRIIIVDDDHAFVISLQATLQTESCQVAMASDREQAERIVTEQKPNTIVIGTISPRGDAFRLHQWLKQHPVFFDVPIMIVDAPPEKRLLKGWTIDEGRRLQSEDYISKPVDPTALTIRIRAMLEQGSMAAASTSVRQSESAKKSEVSKVSVQAKPSAIRVLIADDHAIVREGIRALLAQQGDIKVIGEAVDGRDAVDKTIQLSPDIVIMDILMPEMNGLDATRRISQESDKTKVLVLTQFDDEENLVTSKNAGAHGFIPKKAASSMLVSGIRSVYQGNQFMHSPSMN